MIFKTDYSYGKRPAACVARFPENGHLVPQALSGRAVLDQGWCVEWFLNILVELRTVDWRVSRRPGAYPCLAPTAPRSATVCNPGEHGAVDATFFDREAASSHYVDSSTRHIQALKTTALVDTEWCAVLDVYCSAHWPHDTLVGPSGDAAQTWEIENFAGDNGYDDQSLRDALRKEGVSALIKHRLFAHYDHAHNVRVNSALYGQH